MSVTSELIVGPGRIFVAPYGTALPKGKADVPALLAGTFPGFKYEGDTVAAVALSEELDTIEAESQQTGRTLDMAVKKSKGTVKTEARGYTVKKLARYAHASFTTDTLTSESLLTPKGVAPLTKFAIAIVGPWTEGRQTSALFVAPRIVFPKGMELAMDADNYAKCPIELNILAADGGADWSLYLPADPA